MENKELICIGCPLGCLLCADIADGKVISVKGNTCPKGSQYAVKECTAPERSVTSTVYVKNGDRPTVSVKTATDIPKGKIFDVMSLLRGIEVAAPVHIGDVIVTDIAGTGVNMIATKTVEVQCAL
jgi:CxxC motif-containing protein